MITFDTSGLYALLDRKDPAHPKVRDFVLEDPGPYLIPAGILAEVAYLVEARLGLKVLDAFLSDFEEGGYILECGEDWGRVRQLMERYTDLPLGFADACVIACAERNRGAVLTLDYRRFGAVAREGRVRIWPE